ncbi:unnamed protein product [Coregonus sp. 'balchen']|nr:unnamed protein product [Coregonus sp. 'balchen']
MLENVSSQTISSGMEFPVDGLASVTQEVLERSAQDYMNSILHNNPDSPEHLTLANNIQVPIGLSNVGFVPLYGGYLRQKVLALFSPQDQFTGERIVLYILNRVVYRAMEMSSDELPFLCHGESDNAKILWKDGQAVGFYSVKPSGSLCSTFLTQCYQLPIMDSIFVRKCHRGNGLGLQMLENFVDCFKEDCLGLRYPLSKAMYKACIPADRDLLWEVESVGGPSQRTNIANKIQAMGLSALSKYLSFTEHSVLNPVVAENEGVMEEVTSRIQEQEAMEYTVEIVKEETPVTTRGRSSGLKCENISEESKAEKAIR